MKKEQGMKRIPYGISDFDDFRKRNLYYVDKTRYIRDIEEKGKYLFFIRPRRFGKSLYLGLGTLYNVYPEKELNQGFAYPGIKYSYLVEFKYIKPSPFEDEKDNSQEMIEKLRIEAEVQLNRYSADEKFKKAIGTTTLEKLVLIFSGNRLVYRGEVQG
jgi:hypothetical protein